MDLLEAFADDLIIDNAVDALVKRFIAEGQDPAIVDTPASRAHGRVVVRRALDEYKKTKKETITCQQ